MSMKNVSQKEKTSMMSPSGMETQGFIQVPEWGFLEEGRMSLKDAQRHFLIFGETGSGKTRSGVLPLLSSWIRFGAGSPETRPGMLVIDPKNEIGPYLRESGLPGVKDVLIDIATSKRKVDLFEGVDRSRLTPWDVVEAIRPLTTFQLEKRNPDHTFWAQLGERLLVAAIDGDRRRPLNQSLFGEDENDNYFERIEAFLIKTSGNGNAKVTAWNGLSNLGCEEAAEFAGMAEEQYSGALSFAMNYLRIPASETFARYVWCNPFIPLGKEVAVSVLEAMEEGKILLVGFLDQKRMDAADAVGKVIKGMFFRFTFSRKDRERPLVYVCDEFQRFITGDEETGEQSYIDRCRAMNVSCILATQSPNSLLYALKTQAGSASPKDSFHIIFDNTGNKLFFKTDNTTVVDELQKRIPLPSRANSSRHVVEIRPPARLRLGECYALLAGGRWGIWKVDLGGGPKDREECPGF